MENQKVFVLNKHGRPLMPTTPRKARLLLKSGKAVIAGRKPFTIQLTIGSTGYTQPVTLGIDAGYQTIGFSAVAPHGELVGGQVEMATGMSERLKERAMYRRQRRQYKTRYRKPRFDNRRRKDGWLAPSIQHKLDTHMRVIMMYTKGLPMTKIVIETANFDIQKIQNPDIQGVEYQQGPQSNYWNTREYVLHRDGHACRNPTCKNKAKQVILQVHHLGFWYGNLSNDPENLITLCDKCHIPKNHQKSGFLWGWQPKLKSFRPETFMSSVRRRLLAMVGADETFGYLTKSARIAHQIEKSHHNDAFCIAGGTTQPRAQTTVIEQRRRNNRSLEKFYDAVYVDARDNQKRKGGELSSGRRTRNKNLNGENLRVYRKVKEKAGYRTIRRQRYSIQSGDIVFFDGQKRIARGSKDYGRYILIDGVEKPVKTPSVQIVYHRTGLAFAWNNRKRRNRVSTVA